MELWRKPHLSYWSHFKTQTRNLYEKKNASFYFQIYISFRSRDIQGFKICKLAKWWRHTLTNFWSIMMRKDISANLYQKCLILCSKLLLKVLRNTSLKDLLPWQHTGFQTSPILKAFLVNIQSSILGQTVDWCSGVSVAFIAVLQVSMDCAANWPR